MGNFMWIDIAIVIVYALLGVATLGALGAGVRSLAAKPQGAMRALIGVGALIVVAVTAFLLATSGNVSDALLERTGTAYWAVRPVGAGLISFYILFGSAFLLLIGTEIWRPFKK
jgi:uncharacterized membrane protein